MGIFLGAIVVFKFKLPLSPFPMCIDFARVFMAVQLQIVIINSLMFTTCWYVCGWPSMHDLCIS